MSRALVGLLLLAAVTGCTRVPAPHLVTGAAAPTPAVPLPTDVIVQVIAATGPEDTLPALASRATPIGPTTNCHLPVSAPPPTPPVNPTTVAFDDPFAPGWTCRVPLPGGLAVGRYRAVAVLTVPTCADQPGVTPCVSPRGAIAVGVTAFTVVAAPGAPTVRLVGPVLPGTLVEVGDVVDATGAHWSIGSPESATAPHRAILRDGVATGGWGSALWLLRGLIYVRGDDDAWWAWTGTTWASVGPTRPE